MIKLLYFAILCTICTGIKAQNLKSNFEQKINNGYFFIELQPSSKTLNYFTNYQHSGKKDPLTATTFALANSKSCSIYCKWLNPLKYNLVWKDSIYTDENEKIIKDYFSQITPILPIGSGSSTTSLKGALVMNTKSFYNSCRDSLLYIPEKGFENLSLNLAISMLYESRNIFEKKSIIININKLIKIWEDTEKNSLENKISRVNGIIKELFELKDVNDIAYFKKEIDQYDEQLKGIISSNDNIVDSLKKIKSDIFDYYDTTMIFKNVIINAYINDFIKSLEKKYTSDSIVLTKVSPILEIFRKSVETPIKDMQGYFLVKNIEIEKGKIVESLLVLSEMQLKTNLTTISELTKKADLEKITLKFQKYEPFEVRISSGVFFTKITETEFGVSSKNGELAVAKDDINKNRTGIALYLNFKFKTNSSYLSPLLQFGIDPTKKKPFLLLGGGLDIFSSKFAITTGPIWTWNPVLKSLKVDSIVKSTAELENDIKYEFDAKPKGWYLGIQYNF